MLKIFITTFTKKLNNYKNHFASLAWRHLVKTSEKKNIYILFRNPHWCFKGKISIYIKMTCKYKQTMLCNYYEKNKTRGANWWTLGLKSLFWKRSVRNIINTFTTSVSYTSHIASHSVSYCVRKAFSFSNRYFLVEYFTIFYHRTSDIKLFKHFYLELQVLKNNTVLYAIREGVRFLLYG